MAEAKHGTIGGGVTVVELSYEKNEQQKSVIYKMMPFLKLALVLIFFSLSIRLGKSQQFGKFKNRHAHVRTSTIIMIIMIIITQGLIRFCTLVIFLSMII